MSWLGERRGGDRRDVTDVDRAYPGVTDRREEPALLADGTGQGEQALEVQVGSQEREPDAEFADPPLDGGVVAQEPHGRGLVRGEL
nr:hypothetical protein [Pseudonocardia sp. H11422]